MYPFKDTFAKWLSKSSSSVYESLCSGRMSDDNCNIKTSSAFCSFHLHNRATSIDYNL
jgi:hypothetical protein